MASVVEGHAEHELDVLSQLRAMSTNYNESPIMSGLGSDVHPALPLRFQQSSAHDPPSQSVAPNVDLETQTHSHGMTELTRIAGLTLFSVEEFDQEMKRRELSAPALAQPARKKQQRPSDNDAGAPLLLPQKTTGQYAAMLNHLAQLQGLVPKYDVSEDLPYMFTAKLSLWDKDVEVNSWTTDTQGYANKKQAKEEVSKPAVAWLQIQEPKSKRKEKPAPAVKPTAEKASEVDKSENWMGHLTHFHQTAGLPPPIFQDFQKPSATPLFASTVTLRVPTAINSHHAVPITFGSASTFFPNKKLAKLATAKEATLYLRAAGHMPEPSPPETTPSEPSDTASAIEDAALPPVSSCAPPAQRLLTLCRELALPQPQYTWTPVPGALGHYTGRAFFPGVVEPELQGPVGEVDRVFGKKSAKLEVDKRVVDALEGVRRRRLALVEEVARRGLVVEDVGAGDEEMGLGS